MATTPKDTNELEELKRQNRELKAKLSAVYQADVGGSGAAAQGGGDALGERSAKIAGANSGTIITGTQIISHYHASSSSQLSREDIAQRVAGYLAWLLDRTATIELRGIERAGGAPVVVLPLETAYVPLRAKVMSPEWTPNRGRRGHSVDIDVEREVDVPLNQVLGLGSHLVITGGPGSGKTTVLLHMAWALSSSLLLGQAEPASSRLGLSLAPSELPLPIFVPLASFARYRRTLPGNAPARERTLAYFISHHLISKQADFGLPDDFFAQLLKDGRDVILLLDGLDEVSNEDERAEVRQSVEELVGGRGAMRVVVTCRTVAYRSGRTALGADFSEIAVQRLDMEQHIAPMVLQAYTCIHPKDAVLRAERVDDLLRSIQALEEQRRARLGGDAVPLVGSPLMVRLLLIVHVNNRTLPDERADLFDKAINALLQVDYGREESDIRELSTDWKLFRDMAQHLAFHMHHQGPDQGREVEELAVKKSLRKEAEFKPRIDEFLGQARQRGSVLEERDGAYRFIHLAFQEFLVARYLKEVIGSESREAILALIMDHLDDPWWREPILLLVGYLAANAAKPARDFLGALAKAGTTANAQFSAAELAATAALEWRDSGESMRQSCAKGIAELLSDGNLQIQAQPAVRARAGERLSQLGDPRFDPQRFFLPADAMLGFVNIPADPDFKIGTRKRDAKRVAKVIGSEVEKDEINDNLTPTSACYIGRYLVTVAQFRTFVEATQFEFGDPDALRNTASSPVRYVNWHEALAYCNWLSERFATSSALADSNVARLVREHQWRVTLPSELEWEKAARGNVRDKIFPWGDEPDPNRANYDDTGIGATSAVGCFPENGFGLSDMIGNVWEWTRSRFQSYPYEMRDGRNDLESNEGEKRVVRGGSWDYHHVYARCAARVWLHPDDRSYGIGFRVVLRSPPVL